MFFNKFYKDLEKMEIKFFQKEAGTFTHAFDYWKTNLFERVMRLFVYSNTDPIPQHEILMRLFINGTCGIVNFKDRDTGVTELTAMFGEYNGVGKYFDELPFYMVRCPLWSQNCTVGVDVAVMHLNSLKNPLIPLIDHYAMLLAHADVSINASFINARDAGGVPVVSNENQKQSLETYQRKLYNGEMGVVTDLVGMEITFAGINRNTGQNIIDLFEVRQKLLKNFYADIGIRASFEKRSNAVAEEVTSDTQMLLLNDSDMLQSQKESCQRVNDLFGTSWNVELNPDIVIREKEGEEDAIQQL